MKFFFSKSKPEKIEVKLTSTEEALVNNLGFSGELALAIKNKTNNAVEGLYELQMFDEYGNEPQLRGIKSLLNKEVNIPSMLSIVKLLQSDISFKGYHIFSGGHYGSYKDYFIGAIKTNDQFECLRIFEINGINYNIETKDIIRFLENLSSQVSFSVLDAYHDRVTIQLAHINFDLDLFAKEALAFCPDFLAAVEDEQQLEQYIIDRKGEIDFW